MCFLFYNNLLFLVIVLILAQHLNVVVSGSMEPVFYRGDIVAIETLKGELVGAGNSMFFADEILAAEGGFVVNVSKVFMKPDVYPRLWK